MLCFVRCGCGYLKVRHDPDVSSGQYDVWSSKKHTVEIPTDSFGSLSFSHEEQDREIASKVLVDISKYGNITKVMCEIMFC